MGGLVAVLASDGEAPDGVARRMLAEAPHRGEDHEVVSVGRCALGVQRRPDASDAGLASRDGWAVAFTGAVDDLAALRRELTPGEPSAPTAEVLCAGIAAHGDRLAERLRGTYAVAATDGRRLWCFRDHIGFRSLFYRADGRGVLAACEAKQVVAGAGIAREPDVEVMRRIYFRDTTELLPSALRGVERLAPATVLDAEIGPVHLRRYWHPERLLETDRPAPAELRERFDALMSQAVERTVTGDDVVLLSGGVDSPAVAAYAAEPHRRASGRPLAALSYVYPDTPAADERRYVEAVAAELGLDLHLAEPQANPMDDVLEWTRLADGPIPVAAMPLYEESYRLARGLGAGNVLTGEFAEWVMAFDHYLLPHLAARGRARALRGYMGARRRDGASLKALGREVVAPLVPAAVSAARARSRARRDGIPHWVDVEAVNIPFSETVGWIGRRWARMQLVAFNGTSPSLEAEQVCQEVCGVHVRRPWADVDLWEFFLALPAEVKFPQGPRKTLVRQLLRGRVPDVILDRRDKTVFDDALLRTLDYKTLGHWLERRDMPVDGIDYDLLERRVERRELSALEFVWAKDLASVHAFLSEWE